MAGTALGARQRGDIDVAYVWREVVAAVPRRNAPAGPVFSSTHPHRRRRRDQKTRPKTPGDPGSASGTVTVIPDCLGPRSHGLRKRIVHSGLRASIPSSREAMKEPRP